MDEVRIRFLLRQEAIWTFDGRVLEIFGVGEVARYHASLLELKVDGPDPNGRYEISIDAVRDAGLGGLNDIVESADFELLRPLLDRVKAATSSSQA
jgi:hypothetical protein